MSSTSNVLMTTLVKRPPPPIAQRLLCTAARVGIEPPQHRTKSTVHGRKCFCAASEPASAYASPLICSSSPRLSPRRQLIPLLCYIYHPLLIGCIQPSLPKSFLVGLTHVTHTNVIHSHMSVDQLQSSISGGTITEIYHQDTARSCMISQIIVHGYV